MGKLKAKGLKDTFGVSISPLSWVVYDVKLVT
jgi:hypothetical protein